MSRLYAAITVSENGKHISYVLPFSSADNAISKLTIKNISTANIYNSKKEAEEICRYWNECYKNNDTYMYD